MRAKETLLLAAVALLLALLLAAEYEPRRGAGHSGFRPRAQFWTWDAARGNSPLADLYPRPSNKITLPTGPGLPRLSIGAGSYL